MDCAFLIYQSKNDAFDGTALLEVTGHGEEGVITSANKDRKGESVGKR